jgi:hypothetical protein
VQPVEPPQRPDRSDRTAAVVGADGVAPTCGADTAGGDIVEHYLDPLAALPQIAPHIRLGARVTAIARRGHDKMKTRGRQGAPFVLRIQCPDGGEGQLLAKAVIDASGTWRLPNPLGADGLPAVREAAAAEQIFYGIPDVLDSQHARYAGKRVQWLAADTRRLTRYWISPNSPHRNLGRRYLGCPPQTGRPTLRRRPQRCDARARPARCAYPRADRAVLHAF